MICFTPAPAAPQPSPEAMAADAPLRQPWRPSQGSDPRWRARASQQGGGAARACLGSALGRAAILPS
eukprot:890722-Lingulodinium_polyedra.AAC.1